MTGVTGARDQWSRLVFGPRLRATLRERDIRLQVRGDVDAEAVGFAATSVALLALATHQPARGARLRLTAVGADAGRRTVGQVVLELPGRPVRAQAAGTLPGQAAYALSVRLAEQVGRAAQGWPARPWPPTSRWSCGHDTARSSGASDLVTPGPVPVGEPRIVRHKRVRLVGRTPSEAAVELDAMDYDAHLFTDVDSGEDAIICRAGPTGYRLVRQRTLAPPSRPAVVPLTISVRPAPRLSAAEAVRVLHDTEMPFMFFTEPGSGRGNLLYRRYDGGVGRIEPTGSGKAVAG